VVETLLAYLEDGGDDEDAAGGGGGGGASTPSSTPPLLSLHAPVGPRFRVAFYKSAPEELAPREPVVAAILEAAGKPRRGLYSGSTASLGASLGRPPADALSAVAGLAARGELRLDADAGRGGGRFGPSTAVVCLLARPANPPALARALSARHGRVVAAARARLDATYRALKGAAVVEGGDGGGGGGGGGMSTSAALLPPPFCPASESRLRATITTYFDEDSGDGGGEAAAGGGGGQEGHRLAGLPLTTADRLLPADLRLLLAHARSGSAPPSPHPLTPRAAARILHGLGTPGFPAVDWATCGVWGRYTHLDFCALVAACADAFAEDRVGGGAPLEAVGGLPTKRGRGRGRGGFGGRGGGSGRRAGGGWPASGGGWSGGGGGRGFRR
jgi:ATP-dependent DNA helicase Q4